MHNHVPPSTLSTAAIQEPTESTEFDAPARDYQQYETEPTNKVQEVGTQHQGNETMGEKEGRQSQQKNGCYTYTTIPYKQCKPVKNSHFL